MRPKREHVLGDLHRVERRPLPHVVPDHPEDEAVRARRVAADAPDIDRIGAGGQCAPADKRRAPDRRAPRPRGRRPALRGPPPARAALRSPPTPPPNARLAPAPGPRSPRSGARRARGSSSSRRRSSPPRPCALRDRRRRCAAARRRRADGRTPPLRGPRRQVPPGLALELGEALAGRRRRRIERWWRSPGRDRRRRGAASAP